MRERPFARHGCAVQTSYVHSDILIGPKYSLTSVMGSDQVGGFDSIDDFRRYVIAIL